MTLTIYELHLGKPYFREFETASQCESSNIYQQNQTSLKSIWGLHLL